MQRYDRQIRVAGIGPNGQRRLAESRVLIVGAGALGTHAAETLVRAGVGTIWLVDRDIVEWTNLQRQVLFDEDDARNATPKAFAAAARLARINAESHVEPFVAECSAAFLRTLPGRPDLVLDATDNFPTRYLLNDWCHQQRIPWIYAGAVATEGAALAIVPGRPCLRCLWPEPPAQADVGTCETAGILAPAIAAVSAFQTAQALRILVGEAPARGVFTCCVWRSSYQLVELAAEPAADCACCGRNEHPALLAPPGTATSLCGRDAVQVDPGQRLPLDLERCERHLRGLADDVVRTPHLLRFSADGVRFSVFPGGRALLFGVHDPLRARALYDRWVAACVGGEQDA